MRILVIEDDKNIRESVSELLETRNYIISAAKNGKEGVALAEKLKPNLILCDIMMPSMDGYEVLKRVREKDELSIVPFIFLTAKSQKEDMRQGMDLGADDYLTKPFLAQDLLNAVETRIAKHEKVKQQKIAALEPLRRNIVAKGLIDPVKRIFNSSNLLFKYFDDYSKEELLEYVESVKSSSQKIDRAARKIIFYESIKLAKYNQDIAQGLVQGVVSNSEERIRKLMLSVSALYNRSEDLFFEKLINANLKVPIDIFDIVIEELVHNAFQHSKAGQLVTMNNQVWGNYYIMQITNPGKVNTSESLDELGIKPLKRSSGLGMGLYLTKSLVEMCNGQFLIDSDENGVKLFVMFKINSDGKA